MPKSRGRRRPKNNAKPVRSAARGEPRSGRGRYDVGRVGSTQDKIAGLLLGGQAAPDLMVELLPALLWLDHAEGHPANLCVSGSMTLHHAYAVLGIDAQPRAVDLWVHDERTGARTLYGRPEPYWTDTVFHGHCVLWLPGSRRFLDATVEQYPEVRRYRLGPICGALAAAVSTPEQRVALERGELPPGTQIGVRRGELMLLYTAVEHRFDDVVTGAPVVVDNTAEFMRSGHNLAAQALLLLRRPEVIDRARQAPHRRVRELLDLIGDLEPSTDENGNYWFVLPDADDERPRRLDELAPAADSVIAVPHPRPETAPETAAPARRGWRGLLRRLP